MFDWLGELFSIAMTAVYQGNAAAMVSLLSLVALTEAGIPLPFILDSVLFFTSYKNGPLSIQVLIVLLTVFLGRQFGANVIYWLTRFLGNAFISWLGKRYRSLQNNLDRLETRLSSHAVPAVIVTRLTGLLTLASVASGAVCMRYHYFIVGSSTIIYNQLALNILACSMFLLLCKYELLYQCLQSALEIFIFIYLIYFTKNCSPVCFRNFIMDIIIYRRIPICIRSNMCSYKIIWKYIRHCF